MYLPLLLLLSLSLHAQQSSITLDSPHGGGTVTACEQIVLTPGFSFAAGAGSSLLLQLNPAGCQAPLPAVSYSDQNYILEATPYVASQVVDVTTTQGKHLSVRYYDGLGRPLQEVAVGSTPAGGDLVRPIAYDALGREARTFLPYERADALGSYTPHQGAVEAQQAFYRGAYPGEGPYAHRDKRFEASPLSRMLEESAPGNGFGLGGGHTATFRHATNAEGQVVRWLVAADGTLTTGGSYAPGRLLLTEPTDPDGITHQELKDKQGRLVQEATLSPGGDALSTSYVYDNFGRLRGVIPPKAQGLNPADPAFGALCYRYRYDGRGRAIARKLPDADTLYLVYDSRDRLVMSQDGNQRAAGAWKLLGYDALNRPAFDALLVTSKSHGELRALFHAHADCQARSGEGYTRHLPEGLPALTDADMLSYTFYDSYSGWLPDRLAFAPDDPTATCLPAPKGQPTGTRVRVFDGSGSDAGWLTSATYYDDRYRPLQVRSDLYGGGTATRSTRYAFDGLAEQTREQQTRGSLTTTLAQRTTYDHARRPTAIHHRINSQNEVALATYRYDAQGRLQEKTLGCGETVTHTYSLRGWLTGIGSPAFSLSLYYHQPPTELGGQPRWSGSLSGARWWRGGSAATHALYAYDGFGRFAHSEESGGHSETLRYDANGNITALTRAGGTNAAAYSYTYSGNRLATLNGQAYAHDANGNTTDGLRGMTVSYNPLNLPQQVSKGSDALTYTYDAVGSKLGKKYNGVATQYYAGSIVYKGDGSVDYVLHPEGMVRNVNGVLHYQYNLTDHLGSVRALLDKDGKVIQETNYYPFGLAYESSNLQINKYLYNGMELQDELVGGTQYGMLDYHARIYDPLTGRFTTRDPLMEKFRWQSPYCYAANNPIRYIDKNGKNPVLPVIGVGVTVTVVDLVLVATGVATVGLVMHVTQNGSLAFNNSTTNFFHRDNPGYAEQQKRERGSERETAQIEQKHAESVERNIGEPTPNGDNNPKGGGNKIAKILVGVGFAAEAVKEYKETTGGDTQNTTGENTSNNQSVSSEGNTISQESISNQSTSGTGSNSTFIMPINTTPRDNTRVNKPIIIPPRNR